MGPDTMNHNASNEKLQAQTKFFGGLNEMLNSMEYEIDRLESIKDRLEL